MPALFWLSRRVSFSSGLKTFTIFFIIAIFVKRFAVLLADRETSREVLPNVAYEVCRGVHDLISFFWVGGGVASCWTRAGWNKEPGSSESNDLSAHRCVQLWIYFFSMLRWCWLSIWIQSFQYFFHWGKVSRHRCHGLVYGGGRSCERVVSVIRLYGVFCIRRRSNIVS